MGRNNHVNTPARAKFLALRDRLAGMTEDQIISEMVWCFERGDRGKLKQFLPFAISDCNCRLKILPCPRHADWLRWRHEGFSARSVAYLWYQKTRERVTVKDVEAFYKRKRHSCACPTVFAPCPHSGQAPRFGYVLPLNAEMVLRHLLNPRDYSDPPIPPRPSLTMLSQDNAANMEKLRAAGYHIRNPGNLIGRDVQVEHEGGRAKNGLLKPGAINLNGEVHDERLS